MRRIVFTLILVVMASRLFGAASITIDHVDGLYRTDTLLTGRPIVFHLRLTNTGIGAPEGGEHLIDLSGIDFDLLAEKFKVSRKRTLVERLKGTVAQKLMAMVRLNRTRMDYLEQFQAMIDAYNAGSLNVEEFFRRLTAFAQSLNQEEQRAVGEQLNEEELALFDLLTKPKIEMSKADREKVKATARELLATLKAEKLVLDWRKRQQARAEVRVTIETLLDQGLPTVYTPELFEQKTTVVFQHVYDAYYGAGRSVYAAA